MPALAADARSDLQGQGPSADGPEPHGRGEANTSGALPSSSKFARNPDQQVGTRPAWRRGSTPPARDLLHQMAQDQAALRSPFESKDQAARPSKARGDFRTSGSTERAVDDAGRADDNFFVEVM